MAKIGAIFFFVWLVLLLLFVLLGFFKPLLIPVSVFGSNKWSGTFLVLKGINDLIQSQPDCLFCLPQSAYPFWNWMMP